MVNIAIVGAGLPGRFLALLLASRHISARHNITLYERTALDDAAATGRIAAAMVAPAAESVHASELVVEMGLQSCQLWQPLLTYLGIKTRYQQTGSLILAHRQDLAELRHFQHRVKLPEQVESVSNNRLRELEPELQSDFAGALWLPGEGHIDNQALYQELEQMLRASDISLNEGVEASIMANEVQACGKSTHYDWVIDCRGMGAKAALRDSHNSLRGVRGEVIRVSAPEVNLTRPVRLMHPRYPIYIVPKSDSQYVIGATEIESENQKGLTVRSGLELLSAAYSLHRGFAEAEVLAFDVGLRPAFNDNGPKIMVGPDKSIKINGLYRHGYLLTPFILARTLSVLKDSGLSVPDFVAPDTSPPADKFDAQLLEIL